MLPAGAVVRVSVPEAVGGKTVIGQLAVHGVTSAGWADPCTPATMGCRGRSHGQASWADLNYDGRIAVRARSNRLIVEADDDGDVCVVSLRPAAVVVDINAVTFDTGISSFANRRTDRRTSPRSWRQDRSSGSTFPKRSVARRWSATSLWHVPPPPAS